jgi:hypothetical protein
MESFQQSDLILNSTGHLYSCSFKPYPTILATLGHLSLILPTNRPARTMARPTPDELARMMGGGPKGMMVIWASEFRDEVMHCLIVLNPKPAWQNLPLLSKLGVHKTQYAKPNPKDKNTLPDIVDTRNITLEIFTTDYNPASPTFGIPGHTARGQIVLRRSGQQSAFTITKSILEPMELFLQDRLAAIKAALPDQTAAKLQYAELNPKAYKQFFKAYRAEQAIKHKGLGWEKTECPVELATVACEGCGVDETCAADGMASNLRKWAKCLEVRYCSRECQASDWKAHRPFCKSAKK